MSVSLDFGDDGPGQPSGQVATNLGWSELLDWAQEHEPDAYPALFGLLLHGVSEELDEIMDEIKSILEDDPPATDVADTLHGMMELIEKHKDEGIAVVSGQYQSGDGEDEA